MKSGIPGTPYSGAAPPGRRKKAAFPLLPLALPLIAAAALLLYLAPGFFHAPWGEGTLLVVGNNKIGENRVRLADEEIFIDVET
ncbi:MAG: hypothetical protein GX878_09525, partial [Firmicutes bacterium]|nr:hypothetical protein [Bacillota bacterium]